MQKSKIKSQNEGSNFCRGKNYFHTFAFCILHFAFPRKRGMTVLLVILVLSALLAISIGIFNVVFLETQITGEITASFRAVYIAEQGLERTLYLDLNNGSSSPVCVPVAPTNSCLYTFDGMLNPPGDYINDAGACFKAMILKTISPAAPCGSNNRFNCIASIGIYNCKGGNNVKRSIGFNY